MKNKFKLTDFKLSTTRWWDDWRGSGLTPSLDLIRPGNGVNPDEDDRLNENGDVDARWHMRTLPIKTEDGYVHLKRKDQTGKEPFILYQDGVEGFLVGSYIESIRSEDPQPCETFVPAQAKFEFYSEVPDWSRDKRDLLKELLNGELYKLAEFHMLEYNNPMLGNYLKESSMSNFHGFGHPLVRAIRLLRKLHMYEFEVEYLPSLYMTSQVDRFEKSEAEIAEDIAEEEQERREEAQIEYQGGLTTCRGLPLLGQFIPAGFHHTPSFTIGRVTVEPCYLQVEMVDGDENRTVITKYGHQPHVMTDV